MECLFIFPCSSRFTDSGKYEEDCHDCFKLEETRTGEICNACVLIVKRWKKLPRNTAKNWAHVVDARTGPGTKNIFKQKKEKKDGPTPVPFEKFKHKHVYKRKPLKTKRREVEDDLSVEPMPSPAWAGPSAYTTPAFLANSYWRRQAVCCGVVYLGRLGEVMLDQRQYRPCSSGAHSLRMSAGPVQRSRTSPSAPSSPSSSAFSSVTPSSIESLVEAELQAFQSIGAVEIEDEEFYLDSTSAGLKTSGLSNNTDCEGDEGFCDRLDQKSEQFASSLALIATH
jgi:hypothetical protein